MYVSCSCNWYSCFLCVIINVYLLLNKRLAAQEKCERINAKSSFIWILCLPQTVT